MHIESLRSLAGFVVSGFSYCGIVLADNLPDASPIPKWVVSGGSGLTLTAALIYAIFWLSKELRRSQEQREADRVKMEEQWRAADSANRASQDKLSDSVNELARIISKH